MKQLLALCLILSACAKSEPAAISANTSQNALFKSWSRDGNPNWSIDFPTPTTITWAFMSGGKCLSDITTAWFDDKNFGLMTVSNSAAIETVSGMAPCAMFDGDWNYYILQDGDLLLCQTGKPCVEFR